MTVTPINEPGAAQILASQMPIFRDSSTHECICFWPGAIALDTNLFTFSLDGVSNSAAHTQCKSVLLTE